MKTIKTLLMAALLVVVAAGCGKEENVKGRINLLSENMSGSGKVWVDPDNVSSSASWIEGEQIDIGGTGYTIMKDGSNYYLNNVPTDGMRYAVYPSTMSSDGNLVDVVNNGASGVVVTLHRLALNFHDGGHDIVFPMAAISEAEADTLLFRHLTGAFRISMEHYYGAPIHTLKVAVQRTGEVESVTIKGVNYTTQWAVNGPSLPMDTIGQNTSDWNALNTTEMTFSMFTNGTPGVEINGDLTFFIPVPVCNVHRLSIGGYGSDGQLLFIVTKELDNIRVNRNSLYTIPTISMD